MFYLKINFNLNFYYYINSIVFLRKKGLSRLSYIPWPGQPTSIEDGDVNYKPNKAN